MNLELIDGNLTQIPAGYIKYSDLLNDIYEEEDFFYIENSENQKNRKEERLQLELTTTQFNKFCHFCKEVETMLGELNSNKFQPNINFSDYFFSGDYCGDEALLDFYEIAHYMQSSQLTESLNIKLGGMFRGLDRDGIEVNYKAGKGSGRSTAGRLSQGFDKADRLELDLEYLSSEKEAIELLDEKMVAALQEHLPEFKGFNISFKRNLLISLT